MARTTAKFENQTRGKLARLSAAARRVGHGSTAWSAVDELRQPQDGALEIRSKIADIGARLQLGFSGEIAGDASRFEPEDARLTGGTRSPMRRMLGLNFATRKLPLTRRMAAVKRLAS